MHEGNTIVARRLRLLQKYPDYCTAIDVARMLGITPTGTKRHKHQIKHIEEDGITLYHRASATHYASKFTKSNTVSRLAVTGIDVERLQKICEGYYKTHLDHGAPELVALAKRLAKL